MSGLSAHVSDRAERARIVLDGISTGDAFGQQFFKRDAATWIAGRSLPPAPWPYTDDGEMALGIFDALQRHGGIDQDALATIFAERYRRDPWKGYGGTIRGVLRGICDDVPWRMLAPLAYGGEGSMGNGSAMRVGVLGAWFADDPDRLIHEARLSATVTHAHPDAHAGAIATAMAVALMWRPGPFHAADFFRDILAVTPAGPTRDGIALAADLPLTSRLYSAIGRLGNGSRVTCSDTVPFCLWLVARHPGAFEDALWEAVEAEGDRDTTAAIIGGILGCWGGWRNIPASWLACREPLQHDVDRQPFSGEARNTRI